MQVNHQYYPINQIFLKCVFIGDSKYINLINPLRTDVRYIRMSVKSAAVVTESILRASNMTDVKQTIICSLQFNKQTVVFYFLF